MAQFKKLLDHDPTTGITEIFHGSADGESYTIETVQNFDEVETMLRRVKSEKTLNRKSEMWHAGIIPNILITKWLVEEGINVYDKNHADAVAKKLNSSEFQLLNPSEITI